MEYTASLFDNVTPYGYVVLGVYDNEMVVQGENTVTDLVECETVSMYVKK